MRLEMTISASGPEARSHSPLECVRLSRFIRLFLLPYHVAQPGGLFIGFALDGAAQFVSKFTQLDLPRRVFQGMNRHLAHMAAAAMNPLQKRHQRFAKHLVILRAT